MTVSLKSLPLKWLHSALIQGLDGVTVKATVKPALISYRFNNYAGSGDLLMIEWSDQLTQLLHKRAPVIPGLFVVDCSVESRRDVDAPPDGFGEAVESEGHQAEADQRQPEGAKR